MVSSKYNEGDTVLVEAELLDNDLKPLAADPRKPVLLNVTGPAALTEVPKEWKGRFAYLLNPGGKK